MKTYHVISVFRIGNTLYDNNYRLHAAGRGAGLFQYRRHGQRHRGDAGRSGQRPGAAAGADQGGGPNARAVPWQDLNSAFFEAIQVEAM